MLPTETTLPTDLSPTALVTQAITRVRSKGLVSTARRMSFLAYELYWERRLGIDTADCIPREMLSSDPASIGYDPVGYRHLAAAFRHIKRNDPMGTFLDYGCGKGRVVARAALLPFDRIVGVELSTDLCESARDNIRQMTKSSRCKNIEIVNANAAAYVLPDDTTSIFLFNPFTRHLLDSVVEQIRQSLLRKPRALTILYLLPSEMSDIFSDVDWMEQTAGKPWSGLKLHIHQSVPAAH